MNIDIKPIGIVKARRTLAEDDFDRPNRIGSTICRIERVEGTNLFVSELDAIDGAPVL
jgi:tRNA (Thr-GGU) A37 N-methylase